MAPKKRKYEIYGFPFYLAVIIAIILLLLIAGDHASIDAMEDFPVAEEPEEEPARQRSCRK